MKHDKFFFWIFCALVLAGLFILVSASMGLLARNGAGFSKVVVQQLAFGIGGGTILLLITSRVNYKLWRKFSLIFLIFSFALTCLVFVPSIGNCVKGACRWINLNISSFDFSFQPSELLKFSFVVYLAAWLASRKNDIQSFGSGFVPFLLMIGVVSALLIKQPDVGTLGIVVITGVCLFLLGGGKYSHVFLMVLMGVAFVYVLTIIEPYRMDRLMVFLKPAMDPTGIGYHLKQSLISFGMGGIFGRGFGMSVQKFQYLPEPIGDSVFAVFGEEFGFVGTTVLIGLFLLFLHRGFRIAMSTSDDFGRLLGAGIVILIVVQSFINIGAMIGILPLTGVPLVFVSKGGSALAMAFMEVGVLFNISKAK